MNSEVERNARPAFEGRVPLATAVILAEAEKSPREIQDGLETGSLTMGGFERGIAYLEAGGVVIAEGTIVKRRGQTYFRVRKMHDKGVQEASI